MLKKLTAFAVVVAFSQCLPIAAHGQGCSTCQGGGAAIGGFGGGIGYGGGGMAYGGGGIGYGGDSSFFSGGGASTSGAEQLYPFDNQEPWLHGHFQEIPAYGGYNYFRPYNYKHVLSQSQVAGGWGMSPTMPYSQEYFRRMREQPALEHRPTPLGRFTPSPEAQYSRFRTLQQGRALLDEGDDRRDTPAPGASMPILTSPPRNVDPAAYAPGRGSRVDELESRIREQARQLELLQRELRSECNRDAGYATPAVR